MQEEPILQATNEVRCRGEALSTTLYWVGRQWAVTADGIECRDGCYVIQKGREWEEEGQWGWAKHMAEKEWVDLPDFLTALWVARGMFGKRPMKTKRAAE